MTEEIIMFNKSDVESLEEAIKRLEQANKELKEINTALIQEAEDVAEARMEICNQCGNRDDYNIPCKMIRDLDYGLNITIEERDTYRSALEEIREIINGHASPSECDYYGSYKNACEPCALRILKQTEGKIINKINEVLQCE